MSRAQPMRGDVFLILSAIALLVLTVVPILVGTGLLVQELFGPTARPWRLGFWEFVVLVPVILAALWVGLVAWVPLWTLCVRPFAPRRAIRASLTAGGVVFFSWYCRKIADWLVPEDGPEDASGRSAEHR